VLHWLWQPDSDRFADFCKAQVQPLREILLQELAGKQLDIYIALVTGLICTVIGLLLDRALKSRHPQPDASAGAPVSSTPQALGLTVAQVTRLSVEIRSQPSATGANGLAYLAVGVACISYLWFRLEILDAALLLTLGMVGLWFGIALHSMAAGYLRGRQWPVYLLSLLCFVIGAVAVIAAAHSPSVAPRYFAQWQAFAHEQGLRGFVGLFKSGQLASPDLALFIGHVLGVAALFLALKDAALSMFFCAVASSGKLRGGDAASWIVRVAARYAARPLRTLAMLAGLLVTAFYLVDGQLVAWLLQDFPVVTDNLVRQLLFGGARR